MKTSFFKRQSTYVGLLLVGLVVIAVCFFGVKKQLKTESILPLFKYSTNRDTVRSYNLDFETVSKSGTLPVGWNNWGYRTYQIHIDSLVKHSGNYALRLESDNERPVTEYCYLGREFPAFYYGKEITVKAFMRTEGVDQPIGLLLRIDSKSKVLQFDNMQRRGILGTENWEEYSVTLPLSDRADKFSVGVILYGKGKLWVDDFQVLIDGEDLALADLKKEKIFKAETDTEFDKGSKIKISNYTSQTVKNLEVLGRIWGFLKYFHPAVATGDYNWDAELFRIIPSIIDAKDVEERNQLLVNWINRLGSVKANNNHEESTIDVIAWPDFSWLNHPDLGKTLSRKLNEIKNSKRSGANYYIVYDSDSAMYPNFQFEKAYENLMFYDDSGISLLALFRIWNIVKYFYPYRYQIEKEWDAALAEFIPRFLDGFTSLDYKQAIFDLTSKLNDRDAAYNYVLMDKEWKHNYTAPYVFTMAENKLIVKECFFEVLGQKSGLKKGDIILKINNNSVEELIRPTKLHFPLTAIFGGEFIHTAGNQKVTAEIIRDGKQLTCEVTNHNGMFIPDSSKRINYSFLTSDIGLIKSKYLKSDSLSEMMEAFQETKGLVIDARYYTSNDSIFSALCSYLLPHPVEFAAFSHVDTTQPGKFIMMPTQRVGQDNPNYYKGKVVLLVNEATGLHSETLAMAMQAAPNAIIIGNAFIPSSRQNAIIITLPGNINILMTGAGLYSPDGRNMLTDGIRLDVELKPTLKGIIEGRDELIEKAIEMINESQ